MTDTTIELHLDVPDEQWVKSLGSQKKVQRRLPEFWWQRLASVGGESYQSLLAVSHDKQRPRLENWECEGARLHLEFSAGAEGVDIAQALVTLLHSVGCCNVEAMVYHDECDVIMDDEGVVHPIGIRYFIDHLGRLAEEDYPEIEYEYYE